MNDRNDATRRTVLGLAAGVAATTVAGPARSDPAADAARTDWAVALDDPAIRAMETVWIPMADGTRLAARLFLPAGAEARPVGAVLEYLPYRLRDGYRYRDDIAGPALARAGIALVRVDIRGTGDSEGIIIDEYMPAEQGDALTVLAWIARQPWCNGQVGMRGISYGSFDGLQAAAKNPPMLRAIVSTCGTDQRYLDDIHYRGGCLLQAQIDWAMEWQAVMRSPPDPTVVGADRWRALWRQRLEAARAVTIDWTRHQRLDDKWQYGSIADYRSVHCAVFHVGGMLDCYVDAPVRMMEGAPTLPQKALIGPWTHKWPGYPDPPGHRGPPTPAANGVPGPGLDWLPVEARWWRHWLAGEANGIMDEPRFWAFRQRLAAGAVFPRDAMGEWISEDKWPSAGIERQAWFLNPDGLGRAAGARVLREHRTDLLVGFATPTTYSSGDTTSWWREQSGDDAGCLTFDSAVLDAPLDLMGRPVFRIRVRADRPVAKLFVRLTELAPDGRSHLVSHAVLNLTHRDGHVTPSPLVPGHDYDVTMDGLFTCHRFAPGSRLRVAVSENWWPVTWPSPGLGSLHITTGASSVDLPVRPVRDDISPPFTVWADRYAQSGLPPAPYGDRLANVTVSGPAGQRVFSLNTGTNTPDPHLVEAIGMTIGYAYRARRTIREDDPNSAEMEAEANAIHQRGDWKTRLRAWSLMRSTATHFHCRETLEAWEGDRLVFSRTWEQRIPRDLV
ncbi:CocE/NonD family hydrolase [Gluconacetobacter tumulisoli]|uniref:CocE/NonD family hydrolase n=1 Tax=Gluconacetobacter tumulisoli TaxID=1286189 RepID=A0A7W4PMS1_9PROT|nr:CocE/NonD family hydrolase [Gluconacetobacter tumulisoli]MBB2200081.1 CocE/NonD family hydrolase [Gluconacetobacter tumulisoli]